MPIPAKTYAKLHIRRQETPMASISGVLLNNPSG